MRGHRAHLPQTFVSAEIDLPAAPLATSTCVSQEVAMSLFTTIISCCGADLSAEGAAAPNNDRIVRRVSVRGNTVVYL